MQIHIVGGGITAYSIALNILQAFPKDNIEVYLIAPSSLENVSSYVGAIGIETQSGLPWNYRGSGNDIKLSLNNNDNPNYISS